MDAPELSPERLAAAAELVAAMRAAEAALRALGLHEPPSGPDPA